MHHPVAWAYAHIPVSQLPNLVHLCLHITNPVRCLQCMHPSRAQSGLLVAALAATLLLHHLLEVETAVAPPRFAQILETGQCSCCAQNPAATQLVAECTQTRTTAVPYIYSVATDTRM